MHSAVQRNVGALHVPGLFEQSWARLAVRLSSVVRIVRRAHGRPLRGRRSPTGFPRSIGHRARRFKQAFKAVSGVR